MPAATAEAAPTHYEVLNLPYNPSGSSPKLTPSGLRAAYRAALLRHHPDKKTALKKLADTVIDRKQGTDPAGACAAPLSEEAPGRTVDEIALAYAVLADPRKRAEYDRKLRLGRGVGGYAAEKGRKGGFYKGSDIGVESVDLDDMSYNVEGGSGIWSRGCRCGSEGGFVLREEELEGALEEMEEGVEGTKTAEIVVGCQGCSLGLRVCFAVVEDG